MTYYSEYVRLSINFVGKIVLQICFGFWSIRVKFVSNYMS